MYNDRLIRGGEIDSVRVNRLSWAAEVFFRRLKHIVDDYGRMDARPSLLRSTLFPLKLNQVSEADVSKWLNDCHAVRGDDNRDTGLISFYEVGGKRYLEIINFGQRKSNMREKYPPPDKVEKNFVAPEENRIEGEIELEKEGRENVHAREEIVKFFRENFKKYRPQDFWKFNRELEENVPVATVFKKRDDIIEKVVEDFWNHYDKQEWKMPGGNPITNKLAAFKSWMAKEPQFAAK